VPYELVQVGSDWQSSLIILAHWALLTSPNLPDGPHEIPIPNTGLGCTAFKDSTRPAKIVLYRPAPNDDTLPDRVGEQIARKMKKISACKADGHTTVLILETQDVALMNQYKMLEAVRTSIGGIMPKGLDQLWYAEAGGHVFFDLTGPITRGDDIID
jgi:hypothetical protein